MLVFPNAKINLGLHITEKRNDGYHNIESIFYPIPLCDALEIVLSKNTETALFTYGNPIPGNSADNLVLKTWAILQARYQLKPIDIHLTKKIPTGGGVGGGSADVGFFINLVNEFFKLQLSLKERLSIAAEIGSDCPFFIENEVKLVTGRGEILSPFPNILKGLYLVLIHKEIHVSTADAYAGITPQKAKFDLTNLPETPINTWKNKLANDFESTVFEKHSELAQIKNELFTAGATFASLTGTGSCVYGVFNEKPNKLSTELSTYLIWEGILN